MARSQTGWRRSMWSSTCTASALVLCGLLMVSGANVLAQGPSGLGRPPTDAELSNSLVGPDGADLPDGSGNAVVGAAVYERRGCSTCHGPNGNEGPAQTLVGGEVTSFSNYWPILHWPFAPSIWDYIHRVMPYDLPGILTVDETYAVTAFLLYRNGIIEEDDVMDADSLPMVEMPHRADYVTPETWTPDKRRGFEILPVR